MKHTYKSESDVDNKPDDDVGDTGVALATSDDDGDLDDGTTASELRETCQTPRFHHSFIPRRLVFFGFIALLRNGALHFRGTNF